MVPSGLMSALSTLLRLRFSLRAQLLAAVMGTLLAVLCLNLYLSLRQANEIADIVTDNTLLGSARIIAEAVRVDAGGTIAVDIPPAALEIFNTGYGDRVYYRVSTPWGNIVSGYEGLSQPSHLSTGENMRFHDLDVRAMAIDHPVVGLGDNGVVTVIVAVTGKSHMALSRRLWLSDFGNQVALVAAAGLVTVLALRRGLAPILSLRDAVVASRRERLEPFDPSSVQTELPLSLEDPFRFGRSHLGAGRSAPRHRIWRVIRRHRFRDHSSGRHHAPICRYRGRPYGQIPRFKGE